MPWRENNIISWSNHFADLIRFYQVPSFNLVRPSSYKVFKFRSLYQCFQFRKNRCHLYLSKRVASLSRRNLTRLFMIALSFLRGKFLTLVRVLSFGIRYVDYAKSVTALLSKHNHVLFWTLIFEFTSSQSCVLTHDSYQCHMIFFNHVTTMENHVQNRLIQGKSRCSCDVLLRRQD